MRKQSGFTLIELMVVMAIIAILATAGLSAYGGYLKKARDTTRLEDLRAINTIVQSNLSVNGTAPDLSTLESTIVEMNNGTLLEDPLDGSGVCLNEDSELVECGYRYISCTEGGYVLGVQFESESNKYRYLEDELNTDGTYTSSDSYYEIGNCNTASGGFQFIRL